jgi:plastocyanin
VNAFHVLGALFALWALTVAALGITREGFPGSRQRLVAAVSVVLAVAAVSSAILTAALEDEEEGEEAKAEPAAPAANRLELSAVPSGEFRFDEETLRARPGTTSITMENPSPVQHNVSIEGSGADEEGETVGEGGTSTVTAELEPGRYTFYCSVPGHREGGMEGTLTVR